MSYQSDDGEHEGWDAAVFTGGRFSVGIEHEGVRVLRDFADEADLIDGRSVIGWRGVCMCGWRGPLWERVTGDLEHDLAARKVFDPVPDEWASTPAYVDERIHQEWLGHLPLPGLADVRAAAGDVRKAEARLDDAVARARAAGRSWADVGEAAGMTRQSAHERWARR